jgi:hypothetical protein
MGRKVSRITDPDAPGYVQDTLFAEVTKVKYDPFPPILRTDEGYQKTLALALAEGFVGVDLEFNPKTLKPSILGVASKELAASVRWSDELALQTVRDCERVGAKLVGHSVIGADKPCFEDNLHIKTSVDLWEDTILMHFLNNSDLTKAPGKSEEEGALGLMNLWVAMSLTTDAYCYKDHRGKYCPGLAPTYQPCPTCTVFSYNAIDAWGGLMVFYKCREEMAAKGIPWAFYREQVEFSALTEEMQKVGIRVDMDWVDELEKGFKKHKFDLFPHEMSGKTRVFKEFNPGSGQQSIAWFAEKGVHLASANKKAVEKALTAQAKKLGIGGENIKDLKDNIEAFPGALPPTFAMLYKYAQFKSSGKGTKAWFDERYLHEA